MLIDTNDQARVTDFGIAWKLAGDSELTLTGPVLGSVTRTRALAGKGS